MLLWLLQLCYVVYCILQYNVHMTSLQNYPFYRCEKTWCLSENINSQILTSGQVYPPSSVANQFSQLFTTTGSLRDSKKVMWRVTVEITQTHIQCTHTHTHSVLWIVGFILFLHTQGFYGFQRAGDSIEPRLAHSHARFSVCHWLNRSENVSLYPSSTSLPVLMREFKVMLWHHAIFHPTCY